MEGEGGKKKKKRCVAFHICMRVCVCVFVTPQVTHAHHVIILITRQAVDLHDMLVDTRKISGLLTA